MRQPSRANVVRGQLRWPHRGALDPPTPPRGAGGSDSTWVTFDTPQSRSLLTNEQRIFIPGARPRDARATLNHARFALHILGLGGWDAVVSTGSIPAVPFMVLARTRGIECHFIESATRILGPSMTGALLEHMPGSTGTPSTSGPTAPPGTTGDPSLTATGARRPIGGSSFGWS